jgi:NTE family protein
MNDKPKVAIASQGGGSHAAFAAGILGELLSTEHRGKFDLVALTGTSGGAVCAALAWAGLISGGADDARQRLFGFWRDLEAHDPLDAAINYWAVKFAELPITAEISPYSYGPVAEPKLRDLLRLHLRLEDLPKGPGSRPHPSLILGATEILTGDRTVFNGDGLIYDMVIASAAIPPLFRAVEIGEKRYWDGLFASNPPIRELTDLPNKPTEIWVVQINPQKRPEEPFSIRDINDRRNELAGNLSLAQELYFIDKINQLIAEYGDLAREGPYKKIQIRVVELGLPDLDYPSKLDRSPQLIKDLMKNGAELAECFFKECSVWPRKDSLPATSVTI